MKFPSYLAQSISRHSLESSSLFSFFIGTIIEFILSTSPKVSFDQKFNTRSWLDYIFSNWTNTFGNLLILMTLETEIHRRGMGRREVLLFEKTLYCLRLCLCGDICYHLRSFKSLNLRHPRLPPIDK